MIRLYLFAEGQTEQTFASNVIAPHLLLHNVCMYKPRLTCIKRGSEKIHRGGVLSYKPIANDIKNSLKQDKNNDCFFTTMIDLYSLPQNFPGWSDAEKMRHNPLERVEFLEKCFMEDICDRRFIPYIQLHEYEAYLFVDPSSFKLWYPNKDQEIQNLQNIANQYDTPELINDSRETAPSKRIIKEFPQYKNSKSTVGADIGELIGLNAIREKCFHFNTWLSKLESLGQGINNEV